ncbi:MAG: metallophosphoesterase family protein [Candidatus Atribacteria bacterium]|nr:metallophosphoesterase family protein [Candidatus Atribacteria bacterium]
MKIAVFSDIHANRPALEAVLTDIEKSRVDQMVCLGDLVGYAPLPNETIARIRSLDVPVIMGNYDQGVGNNLDDCGCAYRTDEEKSLGQISLEWTKDNVTQENKTYLCSLLPRYELDTAEVKILFVHGSPRRINEYLFPDRPDVSFLHMMEKEKANVLVCGHTHLPFHRSIGSLTVVNDGSVGRPRDGDWRAGWILLTISDSIQVEFRRCKYQLNFLRERYEKTQLPQTFFNALEAKND